MDSVVVTDTCLDGIFRIEMPCDSSNVETTEFLDWLDENLELGHFTTLDDPKSRDLLQNGKLLCHFVFTNEAMAMAFKLRWM